MSARAFGRLDHPRQRRGEKTLLAHRLSEGNALLDPLAQRPAHSVHVGVSRSLPGQTDGRGLRNAGRDEHAGAPAPARQQQSAHGASDERQPQASAVQQSPERHDPGRDQVEHDQDQRRRKDECECLDLQHNRKHAHAIRATIIEFFLHRPEPGKDPEVNEPDHGERCRGDEDRVEDGVGDAMAEGPLDADALGERLQRLRQARAALARLDRRRSARPEARLVARNRLREGFARSEGTGQMARRPAARRALVGIREILERRRQRLPPPDRMRQLFPQPGLIVSGQCPQRMFPLLLLGLSLAEELLKRLPVLRPSSGEVEVVPSGPVPFQLLRRLTLDARKTLDQRI